MQILETDHIYLTAYETLQIVKNRIAHENLQRRPRIDPRDTELFGNLTQVFAAREMLLNSLYEHSPSGSTIDSPDCLDQQIKDFCQRIQEINSSINSDQIRNLIAIRPQNDAELTTIFSTQEEWDTISQDIDIILETVREYLCQEPKPKNVAENFNADETQPSENQTKVQGEDDSKGVTSEN